MLEFHEFVDHLYYKPECTKEDLQDLLEYFTDEKDNGCYGKNSYGNWVVSYSYRDGCACYSCFEQEMRDALLFTITRM